MPETITPEHHELVEPRGFQKNLLEFGLDESSPDFITLKEKVKQFNGKIRIMVHPFFDRIPEASLGLHPDEIGSDKLPEWTETYPNAQNIENGLRRIIAAGPEKSPALLIFEEERGLESTQEYLAEGVNTHEYPVYYVPTGIANPNPLFPEGNEKINVSKASRWDAIVELLKKLGTKEAIVGGLILTLNDSKYYAETSEEYNNQRFQKGAKEVPYKLGACVGAAVRELAERGIQTELSGLVGNQGPGRRIDAIRMEKMRSPNYSKDEAAKEKKE